MSQNELYNIENNKLFIGSGVEDLINPDLLTELDEFGQYHANYTSVKSSRKILSVMMNSDKSLNENDLSEILYKKKTGIKHNDTIGYYYALYAGYASVGRYREKASSGGLTTWLAVELLRKGIIDGFIHVKRSKKPGLLFEYGISKTISEIQNNTKSQYYPAELSTVLKEVRQKPGKYAVIGIPEIITEVRLLAEKDKTIKDRIVCYFGLVCGHQKTTKYAEAIAWEYGIKPGDLEDIDFRVKKSQGVAIDYDMRIIGKVRGKRKVFTVRNTEPFVSNWGHGFFKARFSDFTDNTFNELADVVFGDAWLDEYNSDPKGNNILIVRNKNLQKIIEKASKNKHISINRLTVEDICRSQQGLIHHTRDELSYRLYKELKSTGWAPAKRTQLNGELAKHRKKIQDIRQEIAEKSHIYYLQAVKRDDFDWFKSKMQIYIDKYNLLYGQTFIKQKVTSKIINVRSRVKEEQADGAILTLTGYFNYGNVVQRYALQRFLKKNGYNYISYLNSHHGVGDKYIVGKRAIIKTPLRTIKRYMNSQKPYWYIPSLSDIYPEKSKEINLIQFVNKNIWTKQFDPEDNYTSYIVGSDQVWRSWWGNREILGYYFLNFLKSRKVNRIAYAVSFGNDDISEVMSKDEIEYLRPYIEYFNQISVREKSAVSVIRNTWAISEVDNVVDPTLLLGANEYDNIIEESEEKVRHKKIQPIFTYVLAETDELNDFIKKVQKNRKQGVFRINAHNHTDNNVLPPVELWLKCFRDAELVITNSFHGMMLSVINNTDFIVIGQKAGGLSRVKDFLSEYKLEHRFVDEESLRNYDLNNLKPINWTVTNKLLNKSIQKSSKWLLDAVSKTQQ